MPESKSYAFSTALVLLIVMGLGGCGSGAVEPDTESGTDRPNILLILTDNQTASLLGTYGNPDIATPHIDRLAAEGIQFNRFYAVNGMCSPTRATLLTGLMPSQHGIHNWLDDEMMSDWPRTWSAIAEFRTLPLTLKNRGYDTALIGKWHLGQPWEPSIGFEHWVTFTSGHTIDFWDNTVVDNGQTYPVKDRHIVDFFSEKAIQYLRTRDRDQPFFLHLSYDGPYVNPPTNLGPARNRYYQQYVGKDFKSFPRAAFNQNLVDQLMNPDDHPAFIINKHLEALQMHNDPATMANIASQNTLIDDNVGKVLDVLRELDLERETLVIFTSDQGNFYGQHGLWQHAVVTTPTNLYETAMHVPLIFRHPGKVERGRKSDTLVGQYDLAATILDYVGIDDVAFENSPGRSFAPEIAGDGTPSKRELVFFEQEETRGVRSDQYAYWDRIPGVGHDELYDMHADPGQENNLADDPAHQKTRNFMRAKLTEFFEEYSDPKYDLWKGGVAKGSVVRPKMFKRLYGDDWQPQTPMLEPFQERLAHPASQ